MAVRPVRVDAPGGPLTVFESDDVDRDLDDAIARGGPTPYGRILWSSARCVADVVVRLGVRGARVVELGCGLGLVSLVAARAGARVLATDVDAFALGAVTRAAAEQGLTVECAYFDVTSPLALPEGDVYVAADLTYEERLTAAVGLRVLEAKARGARVIVGDPGRVFRPALVQVLHDAGVAARFDPVEAGPDKSEVAVI